MLIVYTFQLILKITWLSAGLDDVSPVLDDLEEKSENFALPSDSLTARPFSICLVKAKYSPPVEG